MENNVTTRIRGIVVPMEWDEMGFVISVAIATYSEEKYIVDDSPVGWKLKEFLRKKVTVEGSVTHTESERIITVTAFRSDTGE